VSNSTDRASTRTDHIFQFLNEEISQLFAEQAQPGWTLWAVLGALATVLWLLSQELEAHTFSTENVSLLLLVFSMSSDVLRVGVEQISPDTKQSRTGRFQFSRQFLSSTRLSFYWELVRGMLFVGIVVTYSTGIRIDHWVAALYYSGVLILMSSLGIGLSYSKMPIDLGRLGITLKEKIVVTVTLLVPTAWGLFGYVQHLSDLSSAPSITDYRLGALLLAILVLVEVLTTRSTPSPLISSLREIRRDLICNKIDTNTAIEQVDIALLGLRVNDFLQEEISSFLRTNSVWHNSVKDVRDQFEELSSGLPDRPTKEQSTAILSTYESIVTNLKETQSEWNTVTQHLKSFLKRTRYLRFVGSGKDWEKIMGKAEKVVKDSYEEIKELSSIHKACLDQLKRLDDQGQLHR